MDTRTRIVEIATELLSAEQAGMTGEALARQVAKKLGRNMPPVQIMQLLQERPQDFVEDDGGRWHLRQRQTTLFTAEEAAAAPVTGKTAAPTLALKCGSYVIFDLEATQQDARSPYTEIIQIAAERWLDGVRQDTWMRFVKPEVEIPERIIELTKITRAELRDAPSIQQVLPEFSPMQVGCH